MTVVRDSTVSVICDIFIIATRLNPNALTHTAGLCLDYRTPSARPSAIRRQREVSLVVPSKLTSSRPPPPLARCLPCASPTIPCPATLDMQTNREDFVFFADRLVRFVVEEGLAMTPYKEVKIVTNTDSEYSVIIFDHFCPFSSAFRSSPHMPCGITFPLPLPSNHSYRLLIGACISRDA